MNLGNDEISTHMAFRSVSASKKKPRSSWALIIPGKRLLVAGFFAVVLGIVGAILEYALEDDFEGQRKLVHSWTVGFKGFKVFSTMVGFLVAFKNSKAYYNYWNACKLLQQANGSIYNSFSSCISFSRTSKADAAALAEYRVSMAAYYSLLTAACFQRLVCHDDDPGHVESKDGMPEYDVLGMQTFTEEHLHMLHSTACSPSLVVHWIQSCLIEHINKKVLDLHPALLTRIFAFLHKGVMSYVDLLKFVSYPFPVTYSAAALWLVVIQAITTPFAVIDVVHHPATAFLLTFVLVFIYQALFVQAVSMSNPFHIDEINLNELMTLQNLKFCSVLETATGELSSLDRAGEALLNHHPLSRIYDEHSSDSECRSQVSHRTAFLTAAKRS